ncbi:MAG: hypothetical protein NZM10_04300 [Fimbriimonadales bacterium]|nr:hypothetical protein [Fimbriimonadales bacterium]
MLNGRVFGLSSFVCLLIFAPVLVGQPQQDRPVPRPRERERVERRERELLERVRRNPEEWVRLERELSREALERYWGRLDMPTRTRVSEALGEHRMEREFERRGFERICSSRAMSERPQGFDAVVRHHQWVIVAEAKSVQATRPEPAPLRTPEPYLGWGYGYRQGTLEWARAAAEATLRSRTTNWRERRAAETVLDAARQNRLAVLVFVTVHYKGRVIQHQVFQTAGPPISP